MRAITTLLLLALSLGLSACSNPEAPAWLETYQETGELSGEAERGADASAPDEDAEADTSVEATDVEATDVEAPPLDTSADAGPECGEVEIPCNGVDDDCDPMTHDEACEQPGDVTQYATCVEGACKSLSCAEGTQNQDQMAWVDGAEHCEVTCVEQDTTCDGVDEDCDGLADSDALCPDQGPESISKCYASCMSEPCPPGSFDIDGDASNGCEYACTKSAEDDLSCDGVDDDCDGITDEDYASEPCDGDGDSCASGWTMCVSPDIVCLNDDGEEKACNGHDDDCDGVTDECAQPSDPASYATCVEGACSEESCAEGTQSQDAEGQNGCEVSCDASLSDDTCDGVDQDCDGETDEDVSPEPTSCGQGACANVGTRDCIKGALEDSCVALSPISEVDATCDAVDDDCDGETDEEVPTLSCGKGICTQTDITGCIDGVPQACDPDAGKAFELCDDLDNDCDGQVDEDFKAGGEVAAISMALDGSELALGELCGQGQCAGGAVLCTEDGLGLECGSEGAATDELCDEIDNDCDGESDEDFALKGQGCDGDDPDSCASGVWTCTETLDALVCLGDEAEDAIELCDEQDNDCDGETDEGYDLTNDLNHCGACGYACEVEGAGTGVAAWLCDAGLCTVAQCDIGRWDIDGEGANGCEYSCNETGDEVCDDVDNDCDGATDEGFDLESDVMNCGACGVACDEAFEGPHTAGWACSAGACQISACSEGYYDDDEAPENGCEYACTPSGEESCNGVDDDCDGEADNAPELCTSTGITTLSSCAPGGCEASPCDLNTWDLDGLSATGCEYACTPQGDGISDLGCDGEDDDCDGEIDEDGDAEGAPCPPADTEVVTLGYNHSSTQSAYCALRQDGSVWCWGSNNSYLAMAGGASSVHAHQPHRVEVDEPLSGLIVTQYQAKAIGQSGRLWLWGATNSGGKGDGKNTGGASGLMALIDPATEAPFEDVTKVAHGIMTSSPACLLRESGTVHCWGLSTDGRLGPGDGIDTSSYWRPTALSYEAGGPAVEGVTDLCMGGLHGCLIHEIEGGEDEVRCWGKGSATGTGDSADDPEPKPVKYGFSTLGAQGTFSEVACGSNHGCALTSDGEAYCWGIGTSGQLGYGALVNVDKAQKVKTTLIAEPPPFVSIEARENRSCGTTEEGTRYCWGDLSDFGMSDKTLFATEVDAEAQVIQAGSCQLSADGVVSCMGNNTKGELGQGEAGYYDLEVVYPTLVEGVTPSHLDLDLYRMCVIDADPSSDELLCWGSVPKYGTGGLHDALNLSDALPILGMDMAPIEALDLSSGYHHSCAITLDSGAVCWGQSGNSLYQNGSSQTDYASPVYLGSEDAPDEAAGLLTDVSQLESGHLKTCGIAGESKAVMCWGTSLTDGILSQGGYAQAVPTSAEGGALLGAEDIALSTSTSNAHACALLGTPEATEGPQGEVWCWGTKTHGALGAGDEESGVRSWASPVLIYGSETVLTGISDIAIAHQTTCGVRGADGQLFCWGSDSSGLMGNNGTGGVSKALPLEGFVGVTHIHGAHRHFCVEAGGGLYCWGSNAESQVGPGVGVSSSQSSPLEVQGLGEIDSVFLGYQSTCVTDTSGNLICWGDNTKDYFGQGIYYSDDYLPVVGLDGPIPE